VRESALISLTAADAQATRAIGASIARALITPEAPFVITLEGELGAGKTTLVGGLLNALGFQGHARSPTYTLIEPYELAGRAIYHLDLYRLTDPQEIEALGIRDLLEAGAVFVIEWPERAEGLLPALDLKVQIRYATQFGRQVDLVAGSNAGKSVLTRIVATEKP
jgi:tRNA threonylcarbamoyladenosine biosynthesis protein TsaE